MRFEAIVSLNLAPEFVDHDVPLNFPLIKGEKYYGCFAIYLNPNQKTQEAEQIQTNCSLVENTLACTLQIDYKKPTHNSIKQASGSADLQTSHEELQENQDTESQVIDYSNPASIVCNSSENSNSCPNSTAASSENQEVDVTSVEEALDFTNSNDADFPTEPENNPQRMEHSENFDINKNILNQHNAENENMTPVDRCEFYPEAQDFSSENTEPKLENLSDYDFKSTQNCFGESPTLDKSLTYILQSDGAFKCCMCEKSFSNKNSIWQHRKTIHENQRFPCHICDRKFTRKAMLDSHLIKCTTTIGLNYNTYRQSCPDNDITMPLDGSKPLNLCTSGIENSVPGKALKTSPKQNHSFTEPKPKPYSCSNCLKKFRNKRTRNHHMLKCEINFAIKKELVSGEISQTVNFINQKQSKYSDSLLKEAPRNYEMASQNQAGQSLTGFMKPLMPGSIYPVDYSQIYTNFQENQPAIEPVSARTHQTIGDIASSLYAKADPFLLAANLLQNYKSAVAGLVERQNSSVIGMQGGNETKATNNPADCF